MFSFVFGQRDLNYVPSRVISGESQYKQLDLSKNSSKGFLESFEVSVPPEGWTKINPTGGSGWGQVGYGETVSGWQDANFTQLAGGGSKVAYATYNTGGTSNNDQWLVTPAIDVIADDSLIFYLSVLSNYADSLSILVSESEQKLPILLH